MRAIEGGLARVLEDEGRVAVHVVVCKLEVVGFFDAVGDVAVVEGAVAEGCGQVVAVRGWVAGCGVEVAEDLALGDLRGGCGVDGDGEEGAEEEGEDGLERHGSLYCMYVYI